MTAGDKARDLPRAARRARRSDGAAVGGDAGGLASETRHVRWRRIRHADDRAALRADHHAVVERRAAASRISWRRFSQETRTQVAVHRGIPVAHDPATIDGVSARDSHCACVKEPDDGDRERAVPWWHWQSRATRCCWSPSSCWRAAPASPSPIRCRRGTTARPRPPSSSSSPTRRAAAARTSCRRPSASRRSTTTARCGASIRCTSRCCSRSIGSAPWRGRIRHGAREKPFKAVIDNDREAMAKLTEAEFFQLIAAHARGPDLGANSARRRRLARRHEASALRSAVHRARLPADARGARVLPRQRLQDVHRLRRHARLHARLRGARPMASRPSRSSGRRSTRSTHSPTTWRRSGASRA